MHALCSYIDRMVTEIVKPKKVLFMAIDGVAPRAKLNQQVSTVTFKIFLPNTYIKYICRSAQDVSERRKIGWSVLPKPQAKERLSMRALSLTRTASLLALNSWRKWGNIFVTLSARRCVTTRCGGTCRSPSAAMTSLEKVHGISTSSFHLSRFFPLSYDDMICVLSYIVPGEHKIMQFIRDQRSQPNYPPNCRHCMYGQDADLIMLGLSTHEPHFTLLREVIDFGGNKRPGGGTRATMMRQTKDAQFQLLHLSVLREYIDLDFNPHFAMHLDRERMIDDFVFLTFLVGNDFLPHLPTLDIGEHAFDVIFTAYRSVLHATSDAENYIVRSGEIADLNRLEKLFSLIGE